MSLSNDADLLLKRLNDLDTEQLGGVLAAIPAVGARVLPPYFESDTPRFDWLQVMGIKSSSTLQDIALFLTSEEGINVACDGLNALQRNLLMLALSYGGKLDVATAQTESGCDETALRAFTSGLLDIVFALPSKSEKASKSAGPKTLLELRPAVLKSLHVGNRSAGNALTGSTKIELLATLQLAGVPCDRNAKQQDLLEQVITCLQSKAFVERQKEGLSKPAASALAVLEDGQLHYLSELGEFYYQGQARHAGHKMLDELVSSGIVGFDDYAQTCWMWLEAMIALGNRLTRPVDLTVADPSPLPAVPGPVEVPEAERQMRHLLELWAEKSPPGLNDGSLGVKTIRDAAKQLDIPTEAAGVLACLAVDMQFIQIAVVERTGRGRNQKIKTAWQLSPRAGHWRKLDAFERWAALARGWTFSHYARESGGIPERVDNSQPHSANARVLRQSLIGRLASAEPGYGFDRGQLISWMLFTYPTLVSPGLLKAMIDVMGILGIVEKTEPIALSTLGRAVVGGTRPELNGSKTFLIQGDQTIIAPPDLDADVALELERFAARESKSGALIYRLSDRLIDKQVANGTAASTIVDFLREHSTTEIPQNVAYIVTDAERRMLSMQAGFAASYVLCEDAGLMTRLLAVKAAKLRSIASNVAISELDFDKMTGELAKKGLHLPSAAPTTEPNTKGSDKASNDSEIHVDFNLDEPLVLDKSTLVHKVGTLRKRKPKPMKELAPSIRRLTRDWAIDA